MTNALYYYYYYYYYYCYYYQSMVSYEGMSVFNLNF